MSLLGLISSNTTAAGGDLTLEDLQKTIEAVRGLKRPCDAGHVISSRARPGSVTPCSNCYGPVLVPKGWGA